MDRCVIKFEFKTDYAYGKVLKFESNSINSG